MAVSGGDTVAVGVAMLRVVVLCFLFAWAGLAPAAAEKRVALVIGNSAYKHASELTNPRNDATDMAVALRSLGVEVIPGFDLDKAGMEKAIRAFAAALSDGDVGILFYAGHGLQVNGNNYLVPIDAELSTVAALEFEMIRLDVIQRLMENAAKTNILFLDACRNNPLSRNLARAMGARSAAIGTGLAAAESGVGTLVSFSTQPGNVALDGAGRNSPFAGPLIQALATPGEDVVSILTDVRNKVLKDTGGKQVPWENHALTARFYFTPPATAQTPPAAGTAATDAAAENLRICREVEGMSSLAVLGALEGQYAGKPAAACVAARIAEVKAATAAEAARAAEARERAEAEAKQKAEDEARREREADAAEARRREEQRVANLAAEEREEAALAATRSPQTTRRYHYVDDTRPPDAFLALRTEPTSRRGRRLMEMPNGTTLEVLERRADGWWRVRAVDQGLEGWALNGQRGRVWIHCCVER